jgi:hypothetical protein
MVGKGLGARPPGREGRQVQAARSIALGLALSLLGLVACVTTLSEADLERELQQAARSSKLAGAALIPVYAETKLVARALLFEAQREPESEFSVLVSRRMEVAARRRTGVVVGGPYPELADQILRNALSLHREKGLAGLVVLLVSPAPPSPALAQAARTARTRLVHRPLP